MRMSFAPGGMRLIGVFAGRSGRAGAVGRDSKATCSCTSTTTSAPACRRRGPPPGARQARRRRVDQGGLSRSARPAGARVARPRSALRRAHAAQEPGLRGGRHRHPRPRHRRELGDLHRGQRRGAAAAALRRGRSHRAAVAHAAAVDLPRDADVHAVAGQLPRLGGAEPVVRGDGDLPRRAADADRPGRADGGAAACARRRASCRSSGCSRSLGRGFTPADDRAGAAPTVLLSEGFWRTRFGADPAILGQPILLNLTPYTVIGVVPDAVVPRRSAGVDAVAVGRRGHRRARQPQLPRAWRS